MDFNIIIGWSVTLLTIAGLVVLFTLRKKNRNKRTLAPLLAFARENNATISHFDTWDKTLIGIDHGEKSKLFFIRCTPGREIRQLIDVSSVSACRMTKNERKVKIDKESVNVIELIELVFSFYNHEPDLALEFYNNDYDLLTLTGELQLAQKWTGLIRDIVNTKKGRAKERGKAQVTPPLVRPMTNVHGNTKRKIPKEPLEEAHAV
ncbi:MAG: hypothetical protein V2B15_09325 [Bacteroidota bacterium]